jgi:hypothetical protein
MSLNCGQQRTDFSPLHVTYEQGNPWWNDVDKNIIIHQNSLAILPAESSGNKQEERAKGMSLVLRIFFVYTYK